MNQEPSRRPGPQEAIRRVKQAETDALRIIQNAREQESVQILEQARDESSRIREELMNRARERATRQRSAVIQKAEAEVEKIRAASEKEAAALREAAEPLIPGVVTQAADKITSLLRDLGA